MVRCTPRRDMAPRTSEGMSLTVARVPAGIPIGGQFAAQRREESSVSLESEPIHATTPLNGRQALAVAKLQATQLGSGVSRFGYTTNDLAQDALTSVLSSVKRGTAPAVTAGLLTKAVREAFSNASSGHAGIRHEDAAARRLLDSRITDQEQEHGRSLTSAEVDQLAGHIRDTWKDPRHKPAVGFHHRHQVTSLSEPDVAAEMETLPADAPTPDHARDGGSATQLADSLEDGAVTARDARRRLWNAMAASWGVPQVSTGSLSRNTARGARQLIAAHGGAQRAADDYLDGVCNDDAAQALFRPWPEATPRERYAIAQKLHEHRTIAGDLWAAATDAAVNG